MDKIFTAQLNLPFGESVERVKQALAEEKFGIITEIDVKATLKKKLDIDYKNYVILGACNPGFAHQAIEMDNNVGLLLPCNVIVYEDGGKITVSTMKPTHMLSILGNTEVEKIATEAEQAFKRIFESLQTTDG